MKFSDGMEFDKSGPLRLERRRDGYYVVGSGMLCPVRDFHDGQAVIADLQANRAKKLR